MNTPDNNDNALKEILKERIKYCKEEINNFNFQLKGLEEAIKISKKFIAETIKKEQNGTVVFFDLYKKKNAMELLNSSEASKKNIELCLKATTDMLEDAYLQCFRLKFKI